jgi:Cu+-exporting ATPase
LKKQVAITFNPEELTLRQLAEMLTSVGYEPLISLNVVKEKNKPSYKKLLTQIGVAGFCAGNIMLFSFPEYLGLDDMMYKKLLVC